MRGQLSNSSSSMWSTAQGLPQKCLIPSSVINSQWERLWERKKRLLYTRLCWKSHTQRTRQGWMLWVRPGWMHWARRTDVELPLHAWDLLFFQIKLKMAGDWFGESLSCSRLSDNRSKRKIGVSEEKQRAGIGDGGVGEAPASSLFFLSSLAPIFAFPHYLRAWNRPENHCYKKTSISVKKI